MIKFLYKLFNQHKIDDLNRQLDTYRDRVKQLEEDVREYKGYKLKYEVTKLYVDDDEGLLELFDAAKSKDNNDTSRAGQRFLAQCQGQQIFPGGMFDGYGATQVGGIGQL